MNFLSTRLRWMLGLFLAAAVQLPALAQGGLPALLSSPAAPSSVVKTEQVQAELLAHAPQGLAPGRPMWLGLQLTHQPGWHTYWKNPGDSGLPTELQWTLPAGAQAGDIAWPTPRKFPLGNLANHGYDGTVLLPVPLKLSQGAGAEALEVRLKASWLVCRRECIPQDGEFRLSLPTRGALALHGAAFEAALAAAPRALPQDGQHHDSRVRVEGQHLHITLAGLPVAVRGAKLEIFPEIAGVTDPGAAWEQGWRGGLWTARVPLSPLRSESPQRLPVVVALADGQGQGGWRAELPVAGTWPAVAPLAGVSPALEAALRSNSAAAPEAPASATALGLAAALLGALLGGLILNLMPCVFPVLAIKMLGVGRSQERRVRLQSGVAYTAGVLLSFVALGGLLLALRAAGEQLGWGFQLQSPGVVALLASLFTLIGLNLAGVFEVAQLLPQRLAGLQVRHPAADAFLSGMLAVAVASPCTAPFMGASLGLALALPAWQALAVFAALGLGMAMPYLAASMAPGIAHWMPRPGVWMLRFKQLMAFPMFGTVVWLVWVIGQQTGMDGAAALLALLLLLALLVWALSLDGRGRLVGGGLALLAAAWGLSWALPHWQAAPAEAAQAQAPAEGAWQPWKPGLVEEVTARGQPVLVDFTAAWCVTCQYNKKTTLQDEAVLADARARRVVLLRADWTRRDAEVTAALRQLGRSGVPVYALYAPGKPPVVLSEILSVRELRQALAAL